jgi:hypothetical protein
MEESIDILGVEPGHASVVFDLSMYTELLYAKPKYFAQAECSHNREYYRKCPAEVIAFDKCHHQLVDRDLLLGVFHFPA